jgi:hypothetical protein
VLGAEEVTNTGSSTLALSLGVSPGSSITGFPPGQVTAPGVINATNADAALAKGSASAAYTDAANRPLTETLTAELGGRTLQGGVYAGPSKGALQLTGTLTLDGNGNADTVFIFQTNSSLTTASSSNVSLINGAQACRVFWQVGSLATLGSSSVMVGTVLAQASVTLGSSATVYGRVIALTGTVTLISNTFALPSCQSASEVTTTSGSGDTGVVTTVGTLMPRTGSASGIVALIALVAVVGGVVVVRTTARHATR